MLASDTKSYFISDTVVGGPVGDYIVSEDFCWLTQIRHWYLYLWYGRIYFLIKFLYNYQSKSTDWVLFNCFLSRTSQSQLFIYQPALTASTMWKTFCILTVSLSCHVCAWQYIGLVQTHICLAEFGLVLLVFLNIHMTCHWDYHQKY